MRTRLIAHLLSLCLLASAGAGAGTPALINSKAPEFSLLDQYDQPFDLRQAEGKTVILLASDGEGSKQNREWIDAIKGRYGKRVRIVGIADTHSAPFFLKGAVRNKFKESPSHILLDWKGVVFTSYGLAPNVSNLVLIDKRGIVRYLIAGEATAAACEKLFHVIDTFGP